jgi:glycerophosphoryl diester phosphodiesterase
LIDLRDREALRVRRPLLIAHRGAVGPRVPENSLAALRAAAAAGYDLVEIDVDAPRDLVPVLFHPDATGTIWTSCGIDAAVGDLTSGELRAVRYRASDQTIPTLEEALALCATLRLGVVLDVKPSPAPPAFLRQVANLLDRHHLTRAALLLSEDPVVRRALDGRVTPIVARDDHQLALAGRTIALDGQFWPAFADRVTVDEVQALRRNGALVVVSVAPRRYPPHADRELAQQDIARLRAAGADAFLIDDMYRDLVAPRS